MDDHTVFNPAQLKLLQMMSHIRTDEELDELQKFLSDYFAKRVDLEMDKLWEQGIINEQTIEQWSKEHMCTPYK